MQFLLSKLEKRGSSEHPNIFHFSTRRHVLSAMVLIWPISLCPNESPCQLRVKFHSFHSIHRPFSYGRYLIFFSSAGSSRFSFYSPSITLENPGFKFIAFSFAFSSLFFTRTNAVPRAFSAFVRCLFFFFIQRTRINFPISTCILGWNFFSRELSV